MFGLEDSPKGQFEFDLEKDLHKHPEKAKKILAKVEKEIASIKEHIKNASNKKEEEHFAKLLQGYKAVETVIQRIKK